jgi:hypothetical protein
MMRASLNAVQLGRRASKPPRRLSDTWPSELPLPGGRESKGEGGEENLFGVATEGLLAMVGALGHSGPCAVRSRTPFFLSIIHAIDKGSVLGYGTGEIIFGG